MKKSSKTTKAKVKVRDLNPKKNPKGGPNRREHDHLTDHNWKLEIEGATQRRKKNP